MTGTCKTGLLLLVYVLHSKDLTTMAPETIFKVARPLCHVYGCYRLKSTSRQPIAVSLCTRCTSVASGRSRVTNASTRTDRFLRICKGVAVMRRRSDAWLNATQILKVAGFDKPQRTRVLERDVQKAEHEKVQGGYGKYQGIHTTFWEKRNLTLAVLTTRHLGATRTWACTCQTVQY